MRERAAGKENKSEDDILKIEGKLANMLSITARLTIVKVISLRKRDMTQRFSQRFKTYVELLHIADSTIIPVTVILHAEFIVKASVILVDGFQIRVAHFERFDGLFRREGH